MTPSLAIQLIQSGVIHKGSMITLPRPQDGPDKVGNFMISEARTNRHRTNVTFCYEDMSGITRQVSCTGVLLFDGMEASRLAANYDLDENGVYVPPPPRRGRKPKHLRGEATDAVGDHLGGDTDDDDEDET